MIDRQDSGRIGMPDDSPTDNDPPAQARPRLGRLVASTSARRLAVSKLGRAFLAVAIGLAILVVAGTSLTNSSIRWLWRQPAYTLAFDRIQLIPPPPPWIVGGAESLIDSIRPLYEQPISIFEVVLPDVTAQLGKNPWIYKVERVVLVHPNGLICRVRYRIPVARVDRTGKTPVLLDRFGVVLPEKIDLAAVGPLVTLSVEKPPNDFRAGLPWPEEESRSRIVASAELAEFLLRKSTEDPDVLSDIRQVMLYPEASKGIWVELGKENFLYWGAGPGIAPVGEASPDAKWGLLKHKVRRDGPLKPLAGKFYLFSKDGVEIVERGKSS